VHDDSAQHPVRRSIGRDVHVGPWPER
jgi:hypothetical protein